MRPSRATVVSAAELRDDGGGLAGGEALHVVRGRLTGKGRLVDVGTDDTMPHADLAEKLAAALRGRGEDYGVVTHGSRG
jgi:hypothetical protein